jgi:UDP:flavonoid glycosyltransferase YjiC (YdhE family)
MNQMDSSLPLVLLTQGTVANFDFDQLINPALIGLAEEPVQVVVTAGASKSGKVVPTGNAIVESYIPYELVLPRTSVFVTNGGYNGVQQALSRGVPVVCCGASEDKPRVSARVNWSGVGIGIKSGIATPEVIRDAVREILDHPRYAQRAQTIGAEIGKVDSLQTISRIVNETLAKAGATYA